MGRTVRVLALVTLGGTLTVGGRAHREGTCSYTTYAWNVPRQRAVARHVVQHPYAALEPVEVDAGTGCTVCLEDQVAQRLSNGVEFQACRIVAAALTQALETVLAGGEPVMTVTGYRVGMTRGDVDGRGNRTRFSNHSFGVAIDVNEDVNGLYDDCVSFGPGCRLIRGGAWVPGRSGTIEPESRIVEALAGAGFRWGGTIEGKQKDFMHFSPSGY